MSMRLLQATYGGEEAITEVPAKFRTKNEVLVYHIN